MSNLDRILLPIDFSDRSAGAARYAKSLAARFQAEIILLHVVTPPQYEFGALDVGGSMIGELYRHQSEHASKELTRFRFAALGGLNVRETVLEGDPAQKVVECARDEATGLIVMPTHGYGPFRRFILGSNTAKVLHDADCPVWTGVHLDTASAEESISVNNVLCAIDLGSHSGKTLAWAAWLGSSFGARLSLLHVASCSPDQAGPPGDVAFDPREAARRELTRLQGSRQFAEVLVESGEPAPVICDAAARLAADVLVIGRGSAAGVFGRLRTNAYAIIRQSPCPVVSV
jgi:nucleotide-binding universal stress UspA family protein